MFKNHSGKLGWLVLAVLVGFPLSVMGESEPNNTLSSANTLQLNATENGELTNEGVVDLHDFYQVTTPSDGLFQVGVVPTAELRVGVTLLDQDGIAVLGNNDGSGKGATAGIVYSNLLAGTYFAVVRHIDGTGTYGITANFAPVEEIDPEPNDTPNQSVPLTLNGDAEGHIGFRGNLYTDLSDFYQITTTQDGSIDLTVFPDGSLRTRLELWDTDRTNVLSAKDDYGKGASEKIVYNDLAAGTFYVAVRKSDGYGSYTLTNLFTANPIPNDHEPNNKPSDALALELQSADGNYVGTAQGHLGYYANQFRDVTDFYLLTIPEYGNLTLATKAEDAGNIAVGYSLFDSNRIKIGDASSFNGLQPGAYYLEVWRSDRYGAYTVTATLQPQTPPDPFNQPAAAFAIDSQIEHVSITPDSPFSYSIITFPADGSLTVNSTFTDTVGIFVDLFYMDGTTHIGRNDHWYTTAQRTFTVPNLRAGSYILRVLHRQGQGFGSLENQFVPAPNVDAEPNDMWNFNSSFSTNQTIVGHIGFHGNGRTDSIDCYLIDIPDDGRLTMNSLMDNTGGVYIDFYALREESASTHLLRNDHWYTNDQRSSTKSNLLAGKYMVRVLNRQGYGNYEVFFNFQPNRSGDAEYNDHADQAVPLALNQGTIGHIGFDKIFRFDSSDWYKITLPADGSVLLYARTEATLGSYIDLYHSDAVSRVGRIDIWYRDTPGTFSAPNLRAGTYYIQVIHRQGYGTYELFTKYQEKTEKDLELNNFLTMAKPLPVGELAQGTLGYADVYFNDSEDWYVVNLPVAGTYRLYYQTEPQFGSYCDLFTADMKTHLIRHDHWYRSTQSVRDIELGAGDYFIRCLNRQAYGAYSLRMGSPDIANTGALSGKVKSTGNFPLAEVDCAILDRTVKTDFLGQFQFADIAPGNYTVTISSGAKYYAVKQQITIRPGETTSIDVILQESNKTAPADAPQFYGFARDRYLHLFWSPSESPDVADGGGYKLYINDITPMNLGNVLTYRSDGFQNGVTYTCRLTVYDKFGNESDGVVVVLNSTGEQPGITPTPTPITTQPPQPTPVATLTPTPVSTLPPGTPVVATPTPTLPGPYDTPLPEPEPFMVYEFDQADLTANGWMEIPGGFINLEGGKVSSVGFVGNPIPSSVDKKGLSITVGPNQLSLIFAMHPVYTHGYPLLMRVTARADGANAALAIAALKGSLITGTADSSIATHYPANTAGFMDQERRLVLIYEPDSGEEVMPVIQLVSTGKDQVTVFIDKCELFLMQPGYHYSWEQFRAIPN
ncbi:MAG: carboxypeptidase regulatory-like domain-containing protein [Candidatus Omnitrophota bacterium]|jgi:uncharacterized protein (DUF2141 family)|nr:MAG: carboxypeptidase regulatory-like domain-containing protein [Candidatus Omnitrophota bacterium]